MHPVNACCNVLPKALRADVVLLLAGSLLLGLPDVGFIPVALAQRRQQADVQVEALAPRQIVGDFRLRSVSRQAGW